LDSIFVGCADNKTSTLVINVGLEVVSWNNKKDFYFHYGGWVHFLFWVYLTWCMVKEFYICVWSCGLNY